MMGLACVESRVMTIVEPLFSPLSPRRSHRCPISVLTSRICHVLLPTTPCSRVVLAFFCCIVYVCRRRRQAKGEMRSIRRSWRSIHVREVVRRSATRVGRVG